MKLELRLFREDAQQWAYAHIEIDDALLDLTTDKSACLAQELVPYIDAMQELKLEPQK